MDMWAKTKKGCSEKVFLLFFEQQNASKADYPKVTPSNRFKFSSSINKSFTETTQPSSRKQKMPTDCSCSAPCPCVKSANTITIVTNDNKWFNDVPIAPQTCRNGTAAVCSIVLPLNTGNYRAVRVNSGNEHYSHTFSEKSISFSNKRYCDLLEKFTFTNVPASWIKEARLTATQYGLNGPISSNTGIMERRGNEFYFAGVGKFYNLISSPHTGLEIEVELTDEAGGFEKEHIWSLFEISGLFVDIEYRN
jgi:hypothetical protein